MVHLYIGDGKGKTTVALGLALRAAGFKKRVYVAQFLKETTLPSGIINACSHIDLPLKIERFKNQIHPLFLKGKKCNKKEIIRSTEEALAKVERYIETKKYDVIVLDEILNSLGAGFCSKRLLKTILNKSGAIELILTGRSAPQDLIERADYVSMIKKVKHPFDRGVRAREGIEY